MKIDIEIPKNIIKLHKAVVSQNYEIYIVGGFVRNALLGIYKPDIDLAGTIDPETMITVAKSIGFNGQLINKKLGTVLITTNLAENFEYTVYRTEKYDSGGHHSPSIVEFITQQEIDAKRRDFTANALYLDIETKQVYDYFSGLTDIENKVLRCISTPQVVFKNDGLRILRFIRFSQELNFKRDRNSQRVALQQIHLLLDISPERINKELKQILLAEYTYSIYNQQAKTTIKLFNKFNIYKYLFNSSFEKLKIKRKGRLYKAYLLSEKSNRYFAFLALVVANKIDLKTTTKQNVEFLVNTMLGTQGLRESRENIQKVINILYFISAMLKSHNQIKNNKNEYIDIELCVRFNEFAPLAQKYFEHINPILINKIIENIKKLKKRNVPFNIGQLKVSNQELINFGIQNTKISKIKVILFNECLSLQLPNNTNALINRAKQLSKQF